MSACTDGKRCAYRKVISIASCPIRSAMASALFQIAEVYGLTPCACKDYACLKPANDFMVNALEEWAKRYATYKKGSGEDVAYQLWKDCYAQAYDPHYFPIRYISDKSGKLSLKESWETSCLSAKLKRLRAERGMTQPAFAELLGIKLGVYRSYEQGWRLPKVSIFEGMASRLGVTPGCLTLRLRFARSGDSCSIPACVQIRSAA